MTAHDLTADPPTKRVVEKIEGHFDIEDLLLQERLGHAHVDVMHENLKFLLKDHPTLTLKQIALRLQVSQNTVSRWVRGENRPQAEHLRTLIRALHLPRDVDLHIDPLFLLDDPVTHDRRLQHLEEHLRRLPPERLHLLYPALEQLLKEPS